MIACSLYWSRFAAIVHGEVVEAGKGLRDKQHLFRSSLESVDIAVEAILFGTHGIDASTEDREWTNNRWAY